MPKQVLPSEEDFQRMSAVLKEWGFRNYLASEVWSELRRLQLVSPRRQPGREEGFTLSANGYEVIVWTTWIQKEGRARPKDSGWVVIKRQGRTKGIYFAKRHRTKNFVKNLLNDAWLAKTRIVELPLCPVLGCRERMEIAMGEPIKSRFLICRNRSAHPDGRTVSRDWDYALRKRPKALRYIQQKRKRRAKYRAKRRAEGKPLHRAVITRRAWHTQGPD
jgi:hypothetical protein